MTASGVARKNSPSPRAERIALLDGLLLASAQVCACATQYKLSIVPSSSTAAGCGE